MSNGPDQAALIAVPNWSGEAIRQRKWDWRAAANFVAGGTGTGLLIVSAGALVVGPDAQGAYVAQVWVALGLITVGLLCVMAKIGRPIRALNALRHADTSWMTRELLTLPVIFIGSLRMLYEPKPGLALAVLALAALAFLYCQARILSASKGIPVWSEPTIVLLVVMTGLTEGAGMSVCLLSLVSGSNSVLLLVALVVLLFVRQVVWARYRRALTRRHVPDRSKEVLNRLSGYFMIVGQLLPGLLAIAAAAMGVAEHPGRPVLSMLAGAMAVAGGWALKHTLITRAAYTHGIAYTLRRTRPEVL